MENESMKKRIVSLDVIRVFSCLCVLLVHFNAAISGWTGGIFVYPNSLLGNYILSGRVYIGGLGVSLFFILSGASLMYTHKPERGLRYFYKKRVFNIYPMFWIAFAIATAFDFLSNKAMGFAKPANILYSIAGMDGYFGTLGLITTEYYKLGEWFLGCIILLYVLFPLLYKGIERKPILTTGCVCAIYILCIRLVPVFGYTIDQIAFVLRIPEVLLGMLFIRYDMLKRPLRLMGLGVGVFVLAVLFRNNISSLTLCIATALAVFVVLNSMVCLLAKFNIRWSGFTALANLTYPVFLIHHWLIHTMVKGFDLKALPRVYALALLLVWTALLLLLSKLLVKANKRLVCFIQSKRIVYWGMIIILIGSFAYTACQAGISMATSFRGESVQAEYDHDMYAAQVENAWYDDGNIYATVKNSGSVAWSEDEAYRCGLFINGQDCSVRATIEPGETVSPGATYTFVFHDADKLPIESLGVQMLKEGVIYFGEQRQLSQPTQPLAGMPQVEYDGTDYQWLDYCGDEKQVDGIVKVDIDRESTWIAGWAIDPLAGTTASKVVLQVGEACCDAEYGEVRESVAAYFGSDDYLNSGYTAALNTRELIDAGKLVVHVVSADGTYQYAPQVYRVEILD